LTRSEPLWSNHFLMIGPISWGPSLQHISLLGDTSYTTHGSSRRDLLPTFSTGCVVPEVLKLLRLYGAYTVSVLASTQDNVHDGHWGTAEGQEAKFSTWRSMARFSPLCASLIHQVLLLNVNLLFCELSESKRFYLLSLNTPLHNV
jgi:hypothetical protein